MSGKVNIEFGTSGWRAIIAREFTFENVRLISQAIAEYLKSKYRSPKVIIGYDTRFLSGEFAQVCAEILAKNKIKVLLSDRDTPTPVIAYHIIARKFQGGVNFTASHNPPEYNGIKFSPAYGGPAPKEVTQEIEKRIAQLQRQKSRLQKINKLPLAKGFIELFDARCGYIERIKKLVDIKSIKKAKLKIAIDCMYGTSRDYIDRILKGNVQKLVLFNDYLNPLFGGMPPEPDKPYIGKLIRHVKKNKFHLGLGCDGDADRFGIVDQEGVFLNPNEVFTLLYYYLLKTRCKAKKVARTLATTHMIDAIAKKEGMQLIETPVGFKYIGEALSKGDCLIGGEESGGISIRNHVPEKDGILTCLLIAEMVATQKKPLRKILRSLYKKYGCFLTERINFHFTEKQKAALLEKINKLVKQENFGKFKIKSRNLTDGYKFIFEHDFWVMFRPSGTEPVIRCYFEAGSKNKLMALAKEIKKFVKV
ncbi:MAG: phosphoglucomutase/phosphomannomutase family protein [Candidatus Omnitrophota bacterium]